jgi:hypothetical protein
MPNRMQASPFVKQRSNAIGNLQPCMVPNFNRSQKATLFYSIMSILNYEIIKQIYWIAMWQSLGKSKNPSKKKNRACGFLVKALKSCFLLIKGSRYTYWKKDSQYHNRENITKVSNFELFLIECMIFLQDKILQNIERKR